jgi:hypothetical protein
MMSFELGMELLDIKLARSRILEASCLEIFANYMRHGRQLHSPSVRLILIVRRMREFPVPAERSLIKSMLGGWPWNGRATTFGNRL